MGKDRTGGVLAEPRDQNTKTEIYQENKHNGGVVQYNIIVSAILLLCHAGIGLC